MTELRSNRRVLRSIGAVFAGFVVVVVLSTATDALMNAVGLFPKSGPPIAEGRYLALATVYRSVFAIIGCYTTAKLAPARPMLHALVGGAIGFVLSIVGAIATWNLGPEFGPHWYPISLVVTALPCAWLGGWLEEASWRPKLL